MSETFAHILPLAVYYVNADLRGGQPVHQGQKQLYRTALVQGPGAEPGTLDLYIMESPRSNNPQFAGEKTSVPFIEEATLEDWRSGREFCCTTLNPPNEAKRPVLATQIMLPPPQQPARERMQQAHAEQIGRTAQPAHDDQGEPEPAPAPKPSKPAKPPAYRPVKPIHPDDPKPAKPAKPAASKPAAKPKPQRVVKDPDLEPMDFEIPQVGGVMRSKDKQANAAT